MDSKRLCSSFAQKSDLYKHDNKCKNQSFAFVCNAILLIKDIASCYRIFHLVSKLVFFVSFICIWTDNI